MTSPTCVEIHDFRGLYVLRLGRVLEMNLSTLCIKIREGIRKGVSLLYVLRLGRILEMGVSTLY